MYRANIFLPVLTAILFHFSLGCSTGAKREASTGQAACVPGQLVFMTDFGTADGAVSAMRGVSYGVSGCLRISDLTHQIPPFNIWEGAYRLQQTYPYWPANTVFVLVVDPGVGSERKPVVAKLKSGHLFVFPDNGLLTLFNDQVEAVRVIDVNKHLRRGSEQSHTFHGRDLFAVTGAKLASGRITFEEVGPELGRPLIQLPVAPPEFLNGAIKGMVPVLDPNYGNVWTNIPKSLVAGSFTNVKNFKVTIRNKGKVIFSRILPLAETFSAVKIGEPLLYFNSLLNVALALNQGNFALKYNIGSGPEWRVTLEGR